MSHLNFATLYLGSAEDVAEMLDGGDHTPEATMQELQAALINAHRRIAVLEKHVANLRKDLDV
jgi:hypothetical protein